MSDVDPERVVIAGGMTSAVSATMWYGAPDTSLAAFGIAFLALAVTLWSNLRAAKEGHR